MYGDLHQIALGNENGNEFQPPVITGTQENWHQNQAN